jgi:subtilisin family serine protease
MGILRRQSRRGKSEIIVVTKTEGSPLEYDAESQRGVNPPSNDLLGILSSYDATIRPVLRKRPPAAPTREMVEAHQKLTRFHSVSVSPDKIEEIQARLRRNPLVETVYVKPPGEPPVVLQSAGQQVTAGAPGPAGPATPDLSGRQDYLGPTPVGIDARFAWTLPGGGGTGVNLIDCEWSWNFQHEDLAAHCNGAVVGTAGTSEFDHGTAVAGVLIANNNGLGIIGVAPDATLSMAAFDDSSDQPTSAIIIEAADKLAAGDILLLEIHRPGLHSANPPVGQQGFIAIEWWPDDFQAIKYATSKGIIVVEAAGNGAENLDDPSYNTSNAGFPADWQNPFAAGGPDSGAILVGAGNPPPGTHGRNQDTLGFNEIYFNLARCGFSNYGARVDCQGWGWEVTTLGYGDLQSGNQNILYTDVFAGTSSASPMVAGVIACLQGRIRAAGAALLTPFGARNLLRTTGAPQQSTPDRPGTQTIGRRPDLRAMLTALGLAA